MKVTIDTHDTVATVKFKLSKALSINGPTIGLVFQNVTLHDDKVISYYKISSDQSVLWFLNVDDSKCSSQTGRSGVVQFQYFTVKDWTAIGTDRNTGSFSISQVTNLSDIIDGISSRLNCPRDSIKLYQDVGRNKVIGTADDFIDFSFNDDVIYFIIDSKQIEVFVLLGYIGKTICTTVSYDDQIGVLDGHLRNIALLPDTIEYSCKVKNLDKHKTFRHYDIDSNETILAIQGGGGPSISLSDSPNAIRLVPLHPNVPLLYIDESYESYNLSDIVTAMSNHLNYPTNQIKLFQDQSKTNPIQTNQHLQQIIQTDPKQIYFFIDILFLKNNCTKLELLDTGVFGVVHRYREVQSNEDFAVKKLSILKSKINNSLLKEVEVLSALCRHERIIKFIMCIETDGALYIVMEYMDKGSLGSYVRNHGALTESQIWKYSKQILEALKYLHDNQILHRDIKGKKILLDKDDNAKLADFGLAKILQDIASLNFLNGVEQSSVGTANWMAPEVINGECYGPGADIWSFGATMVEMLTGKPPYHELNVYHILLKIGTERTIKFSRPSNISCALETFIMSCLCPDQNLRPTCDKLLEQF